MANLSNIFLERVWEGEDSRRISGHNSQQRLNIGDEGKSGGEAFFENLLNRQEDNTPKLADWEECFNKKSWMHSRDSKKGNHRTFLSFLEPNIIAEVARRA